MVVREEEHTKQQQLVAFVSMNRKVFNEEEDTEAAVEVDLRRFANAELPYYMVPQQFVFMDL